MDNEIIKALECIAREEIKCAECAYGEYCYPVCQNLAGRDALDLIKRQKAEIERLKTDNLSMQKTLSKMSLGVEQAIAEAIKDFAERLKENEFFANYTYKGESRLIIDNLVKQMIGEQDESIQQEDC